MLVTTKIGIDLQRPYYPAVINAVQGDQNTRRLEISLYSGGTAWPIPEGTTVAMRYCKSDKTKGYYDTMPDGASAWSIQGNVITVLLAPQMLTVAGTVFAQAEMIQGSSVLATFTMQINVEENPAAGVLQSEDYVNWLQWMEDELDAYLEKVKVNSEILGGTVVGPINMNGQPLSGLNPPTANNQAANKGYVDRAVKKAAPRNLLDNSYWAKPSEIVNQRGQTSYNNNGYAIDRWQLWNSNLNVSDRCCELTGDMYQLLENVDFDKIYTFAIKTSDNLLICNGSFTVGASNSIGSVSIGLTILNGRAEAVISSPNTATEILWAALYEGEYTSETLPEYQPKGYATELLECQWYFHRYTLASWGSLPIGRNEGTGTMQFKTQLNIPPLRIKSPTVKVSCSGSLYVAYVDGTTSSDFTVSEIGGTACTTIGYSTSLELRGISVLTSWKFGALTARDHNCYIDFCADL